MTSLECVSISEQTGSSKFGTFRKCPLAVLEETMLWTVLVIMLVLWLLGFSLHVGGGLIHLLLVVAVVVLIFNLLSGRRTV